MRGRGIRCGAADLLLEATDAAYAALMADAEAKRKLEEERALWDTTLMDGLEDEP